MTNYIVRSNAPDLRAEEKRGDLNADNKFIKKAFC